jgi:hypothetical protein
VVIVDSALASTEIVSFVATDKYKGGQLAADRLGALLHGAGTALLLRYQEGSASTTEREQGFLDRMKASFPGVPIPRPGGDATRPCADCRTPHAQRNAAGSSGGAAPMDERGLGRRESARRVPRRSADVTGSALEGRG